MFEKYDINDLYLASIDVTYSGNSFDTDVGTFLLSSSCGYGYITIIKKEGDIYIDLQNEIKVPSVDCHGRHYAINYMEPLSKYYVQQDGKKNVFSKRKSISIAKKYIDDFYASHLEQIK